MIRAFSTMSDVQRYYPVMAKSFWLIGAFGFGVIGFGLKQKSFHDCLINKYFSEYTDE